MAAAARGSSGEGRQEAVPGRGLREGEAGNDYLGAVAAGEQQITKIEADSLERLPRNGGDNVLSQSRNERLFIGNVPVKRAGGNAEGGCNAAHGDVAQPIGIKQGNSGVDNTLAIDMHLGDCTD